MKRGLGRNSAISVSIPRSHALIREGVRKAVDRHRKDPLSPLVWEGPYEMEIRYFDTDDADGSAARPGVERVDDQTVRARSDTLRDLIYL